VKSIRQVLVAVAALAAVTAGSGQAATVPTALQAQVVDIQRPVSVQTYKTIDPSTGGTGTQRWRVVQGTGNCCENYLTTTSGGRLFDFGGSYLNYTDNRGISWKSVRSLEPLVNGEGTVNVAPNGDVIGVEWDPYSGDHLLNFKYEAASGQWWYFDEQLHQPFYDREWIGIVPGPISIDGVTYPYVTFLKGGYPTKEVWLYSTDGLHYLDASSKFVDSLGGTVQSWLATHTDPTFDWIQPNTNMGLTPLAPASALAQPDFPFSGWSLLDPSLTWNAFQLPGGTDPQGFYQVDAAGRIHDVVPINFVTDFNGNDSATAFLYRMSSNGGQTWKTVKVTLPTGYSVDQIDFRANKAAGVAAVAVHELDNNPDAKQGDDQDYLYKFDIVGSRPVLKRIYLVGLGDAGSQAGVGNSVRMDFQTVTIFGDGRVAMSFLDSTTHYASPTTGADQQRPALAVELR
jgi:hypothetical protein